MTAIEARDVLNNPGEARPIPITKILGGLVDISGPDGTFRLVARPIIEGIKSGAIDRVVVSGPLASGKTTCALALGEILNGLEIAWEAINHEAILKDVEDDMGGIPNEQWNDENKGWDKYDERARAEVIEEQKPGVVQICEFPLVGEKSRGKTLVAEIAEKETRSGEFRTAFLFLIPDNEIQAKLEPLRDELEIHKPDLFKFLRKGGVNVTGIPNESDLRYIEDVYFFISTFGSPGDLKQIEEEMRRHQDNPRFRQRLVSAESIDAPIPALKDLSEKIQNNPQAIFHLRYWMVLKESLGLSEHNIAKPAYNAYQGRMVNVPYSAIRSMVDRTVKSGRRYAE